MSDKWYDHLKPSNGAEAGCYRLLLAGFLLAGAVYVEVATNTLLTTIGMTIMVMWVYWLVHITILRRSKQLENFTTFASYKLRWAERMLVLIGLGTWFFFAGLSYLAAFWNWPLLSFLIGIAGLGGLLWFWLNIEPVVDFLLKRVGGNAKEP
jgi:hypothetical protein